MSSETTQPTYAKYFIIWAGLIALLVAGTYVSYLPISKTEGVLLILFITGVKFVPGSKGGAKSFNERQLVDPGLLVQEGLGLVIPPGAPHHRLQIPVGEEV